MKKAKQILNHFYHLETSKSGLWSSSDVNGHSITHVFGVSKINNPYQPKQVATMIIVGKFKLTVAKIKE